MAIPDSESLTVPALLDLLAGSALPEEAAWASAELVARREAAEAAALLRAPDLAAAAGVPYLWVSSATRLTVSVTSLGRDTEVREAGGGERVSAILEGAEEAARVWEEAPVRGEENDIPREGANIPAFSAAAVDSVTVLLSQGEPEEAAGAKELVPL